MRRKVLLVGWDAADWKVIRPLMDAGRMPNLARLVETGASGSIATLHPPFSPMLWTSIATGKRPFRHGVLGFVEPTAEGDAIRPVSGLSRKTKALWNILNQNEMRSLVVGWWPSHPAEPINGVMVSDQFHRAESPIEEGWPLPPASVHPPALADKIAALRVHPDTITPAMIEPFIPRAAEVDQDRDNRLGLCMKVLAEFLSVHNAAEWLIENEAWDLCAVYFDSIDHFGHLFMKFHPPRREGVSARDFELYSHAIAAAYQLHDEKLGHLMAKAGPDTTILLVSDHGFHPDHLRPRAIPAIPAGPAIEHRSLGIIAMRGDGIRAGGSVGPASILDVTPTVLALYGLPVGDDMDGRVLSQAFTAPPRLETIPSWDDVAGGDGRHPPHARLDALASQDALEQLIALGYVERPGGDRRETVESAVRELKYNLGESLQDAGRHHGAYELFLELRALDPDEQRFAVCLFASCQALGRVQEMREIVADMDGRRRAMFEAAPAKLQAFRALIRARAGTNGGAQPAPPFTETERRELAMWRRAARFEPGVVNYLKARVLTFERRYAEALEALAAISDADTLRPGVLLDRAGLMVRLGRAEDARREYEAALAIDPENADAHEGLCMMAIRRRDADAAVTHGLSAIGASPNRPLPHYLLGRALEMLRDSSGAAQAYRSAISLNPNFPQAHLRLASLAGDAGEAREHRAMARQMRNPRGDRPASGEIAAPERRPAAVPNAEIAPDSKAARAPGEALIVVTGLPRSGTSMLMQMLAAGGVSIVTDDRRLPDEDNPRGYFEFDAVRSLMRDSKWLARETGKAVKIVAPLIGAIPADLPCRVILIERDIDEVIASQQRMLARNNRELPRPGARLGSLKAEFAHTLDRTNASLAERAETRVLRLKYAEVVENPGEAAQAIAGFLNMPLDVKAMASAVDPALYRNRAAAIAR